VLATPVLSRSREGRGRLAWRAPFGSQRVMRSVEDFTEFEQRAAYLDGDPVQPRR
jgi:hypothetical protein